MSDVERQIANQRRALRLIDLDEYYLTPTGGARTLRDERGFAGNRIPPAQVRNMVAAGWLAVSPEPPARLVITEAGYAAMKVSTP